MKIIDDLKHKWRVAKMPVTFNEEDIKLLAVMNYSYLIDGKMKLGGLFNYSFYEPLAESDMDFARHLFERNGINVKRYSGRSFLWTSPKTVLRIRSKHTNKGQDTIDFFEKIDNAYAELSRSQNEWYELQQALNEKKQEYNAR